MASINDTALINRPSGPAAPDTAEAEAEEEAFVYAMLLTSGCALPMVVRAVIELDALGIIAGSGAQVSAAEVAAHLPTRNPDAAAMLDRMFRLLAAYSVLTCSLRPLPDGGAERLYGLAPVSKHLTSTPDAAFLAPFSLLHQHKVPMESWYHLKDAVLEGGVPFNMAHGMTPFEYQAMDPKFNDVFNGAMSSYVHVMNKILRIYNGFEGLSSVVDVGGGVGVVSGMIVSKHPQIRVVNFDLPHVIKNAHSYPGVKHVSGDMFVDIPKGDAILLKWICHACDDEHCLKLLLNCYKAVPQDGKVIVLESIVTETPNTSLVSKFVAHKDLIMLANLSGKERTKREFEALAKGAGFAGIHVLGHVFDTWILEFFKNPQ